MCRYKHEQIDDKIAWRRVYSHCRHDLTLYNHCKAACWFHVWQSALSYSIIRTLRENLPLFKVWQLSFLFICPSLTQNILLMAKFPSAAEKSCPPTAGTPSPHWYLHCSCCRHSHKAHWFQAGNLMKPWVGRKRKPWVVCGMFVLTKLVFCSFQIKQTLLSLIIFECFYFILSICREILQFFRSHEAKINIKCTNTHLLTFFKQKYAIFQMT